MSSLGSPSDRGSSPAKFGMDRRGKLGRERSRLAGSVVARWRCNPGFTGPSIVSGRNMGWACVGSRRRGDGRGVLDDTVRFSIVSSLSSEDSEESKMSNDSEDDPAVLEVP